MHTPLASNQAPERRTALRTEGLGRSFGKVCAVRNLNLTVREGEIYGFLGTNGAGKTTTIRMLMGIIKPESGTIELLGEKTRRTTVKQKQSLGYVSQEQNFYGWMTCARLGRFVAGLYPSWDMLEFERLLQVFDVPPDRKVSQLSGGMRVKLALALALAPRPPLLILDEPTSGLDPLARREFLEIVQQQAEVYQRTTFFSSHRIDEIERVADRIGIIHSGELLYEGTLPDLVSTVRMIRPPRRAPVAAPAEFNPAEPVVTLPPGFEILRASRDRDRWCWVARAEPAAWNHLDIPGAEIAALPLEDIFISMVRRSELKS